MKKIIIVFILLIMMPLTVFAYPKGDIDGNNKVDNMDYQKLRSHILEKVKPTGNNNKILTGDALKRADVDGKNGVDNADYVALRSIILANAKATPTPKQNATATPANTPKQNATATPTPKSTNTPKTLTEAEKICENVKNNSSIDYKSFITLSKKVDSSDKYKDDYYAIKAAHDCANKYNKPVKITKGTYHIYKKNKETITVQTNTDLNNSTFYIHDEKGIVNKEKKYIGKVYNIASKEGCTSTTMTINNLKEGTVVSKLAGSSSGKYVKVKVKRNDVATVYNRSYTNGTPRNTGASSEKPQEAFRVDANGKVLDPIMWNYDNEELDVTICNIPNTKLTFQNAKFFTIVNTNTSNAKAFKNAGGKYLSRQIRIERSNTTINNITHAYMNSSKKIVNDVLTGYYGFFNIHDVANITVTDCKVSAKNKSYDFALNYVINGQIDNLTLYDYNKQSDYFDQNKSKDNQFFKGYWHVVVSNHTKNLSWNNCVLNGHDGTHKGKYNTTISNSRISGCISILGMGDVNINNTKVYDSSFICLRGEYGQTWKGTVNIKNSDLYPSSNDNTFIIKMGITYYNNPNNKKDKNNGYVFNNGYDLYLPKVNVNGLKIHSNPKGVYVFNNSESTTGKVKGDLRKVKNYIKDNAFKFTYTKKEDITVKNVTNKSGEKIKVKNYIVNFGEN